MFKRISAILITAGLASCSAGPVYAQNIPYIAMESCADVASVAEFIMQSRQDGVPMKAQYDRAEKTTDTAFKQWAKEVIIIAYNEPKYTSKTYKQQAVAEFGSRAFMECLKVEKNIRK